MADLTIAPGGPAAPASLSNPLPVTSILQPAGSAPLSGVANASGDVGPFVPELARDMWITLTGNGWAGSAQVMRSIDGGATKYALTAGGQPWANYEADAHERIGQETVGGAVYYIRFVVTAGSVAYDLRQ